MERNAITLKGLVYSLAGAAAIEVRRDVPFAAADGGALVMDLYYPPAVPGPLPAVLIVEGYEDAGFERMLGCRFKEMASVEAWARLLAASGIVAAACTNRDPVPDAHALVRHLRENAEVMGLDPGRIGLLASSGHGPAALSVAMSDRRVKCAALLYAYTMDLDGSTAVAEAQKAFKFAGAGDGTTVGDLPADMALFIG